MNKQQLATLKSEILSSPALIALGQDYPAIAAALNARPQVPNPEEQQQTPKALDTATLYSVVLPSEAATIYSMPRVLGDIERACATNDRALALRLFGIAAGAGWIGASTVAALQAMLAETEPDPTWTETVPGQSRAEELGLPVVSPADVQLVFNC